MTHVVSKPKLTGKAALIALAQLAALGCGSQPDATLGGASTAGGAAVTVQALEQEQVSRLYSALRPTEDPIAAAGHGVIVQPDGTVIKPTPEFVRTAQQYYIDRLYGEANDTVKAEFDQERPNLEPVVGQPREFIMRAGLIDFLNARVQPIDFEEIDARNRFLVYAMEPDDLAFVEQGTQRAEYLAECQSKGVPTPPDWAADPTKNGWKLSGPLEERHDFIGKDTKGTVWYKISEDPERPGLCIALPRVTTIPNAGGEIQYIDLLGIICQGKKTGNACFWDNKENFFLPLDPEKDKTILNDFKSAADLFVKGDVCTSCHRGENAFIVHPESALNIDRKEYGPDWKFKPEQSYLRAKQWMTPLVVERWPKNPEWTPDELARFRAVELDNSNEMMPETSCLDCHTNGGEGGGLGKLDTFGYCNSVMKKALLGEEGSAVPKSTMPPLDYLEGRWVDKTPHAPSKGHRDFILDVCSRVTCGDGKCTGTENNANCAQDCPG